METVNGQRYLGCGGQNVSLKLAGTAGNALGAYLDSGRIELFGNAQDQTSDTMNGGQIIIHGSCGDTAGYAMRGGCILIEHDVGYRAGIHMKSYGDMTPQIIIGGITGSFLGEYQAGGDIVVLNCDNIEEPTGDFTSVGMYGGRVFIHRLTAPKQLPQQLSWRWAQQSDIESVESSLRAFADAFSKDADELLSLEYILLTPNTENPYKQMYVNA